MALPVGTADLFHVPTVSIAVGMPLTRCPTLIPAYGIPTLGANAEHEELLWSGA